MWVQTWVRAGSVAGVAGAAVLLAVGPAQAVPPAGGTCQGQFVLNTTLVNPDDPGFFTTIDRNGDGVICIKDYTGPDPDPLVGFLAIDNMAQHNR